MPVIDTTLLVDAAQRDARAVAAMQRLRSQGDPLLLPAVAVMEFLAGEDHPVQAYRWLEQDFRIVHSSEQSVLRASQLFADARRRGRRPAWNDTAIAAIAALEGTYVATANKRDFAQLGVPAWNYLEEADPPRL